MPLICLVSRSVICARYSGRSRCCTARFRPPWLIDGWPTYATRDRRSLATRSPAAEVLFVWDFTSDAVADAWPAADSLRWVHTASAGVDRLLFPELRRLSDVTSPTPAASSTSRSPSTCSGWCSRWPRTCPPRCRLQRQRQLAAPRDRAHRRRRRARGRRHRTDRPGDRPPAARGRLAVGGSSWSGRRATRTWASIRRARALPGLLAEAD